MMNKNFSRYNLFSDIGKWHNMTTVLVILTTSNNLGKNILVNAKQRNHPGSMWCKVATGRLYGLREAHSHTGNNQGSLGVRGSENGEIDFMSGWIKD